jgi:ssRNA-specific RNase YbeY (16S rRNA maturation enzyme)
MSCGRYDHETDEDYEQMVKEEERIIAQLRPLLKSA